MDGGRASLVLASCPPPSRPDGPVVTDDPARIRDPSRDVLLDDLVLEDRYALRRYDAAREVFSRLPASAWPGPAADFAYAFVQAYVDLAVRVERITRFLQGHGTRFLSIPPAMDRWTWAAGEAARRFEARAETYAAATPRFRSAGAGRARAARLALRIFGPFLLIGYRRRPLRILTTDLGLLDAIVPALTRRTGVLSPGLGVAERAGRGLARFAWLRHASVFRPPALQANMELDEAARVLALQDAGALADLLAPLQDALASGSVEAVVLPDDKAPVNHACMRLATGAHVPSLVVQHGITGHPVGFLPLEASRFACWGPACSEWLRSRGAPAEALAETGDPRYDQLFRDRTTLMAEGRSRFASLGASPDAKVVVFFSQPSEGRAAAYRMVLDATRGLPLTLITKVHPAEGVGLYRGLARQRSIEAAVVSGPANPYLAAADVVLTQSSGLAVVAAQLGSPTVLLEPVTLENIQAYDARWPRATDAPSLRAQLDSVLRGTHDRERIRALGLAYGGPADGRAGERVARVIEGMVKDRA